MNVKIVYANGTATRGQMNKEQLAQYVLDHPVTDIFMGIFGVTLRYDGCMALTDYARAEWVQNTLGVRVDTGCCG
jgi:hypothetical protein